MALSNHFSISELVKTKLAFLQQPENGSRMNPAENFCNLFD
jgi:hypothetical protein